MATLPYRDRSYPRFVSERTRETIFEIKMLDGSIIVWGACYRPSEFRAALSEDRRTVIVNGTLRDRNGPVVTFDEFLNVTAAFRVEVGELSDGYDVSWSRDHS